MASDRSSSPPLPPRKIPVFLAFRLNRIGRQDVKKYSNLEDSTRTHSTLLIEQVVLAGQGAVNQWLINSMVPLVSGNGQIRGQVEAIRDDIEKNQPQDGESKRILKRKREANAVSENKITNLLQQCISNVAQADARILAAEDAMRAWVDYYQALSATYMRARTRKNKKSSGVAMAAIPAFSSRPMSQVPEFEKNACSEIVKVRK